MDMRAAWACPVKRAFHALFHAPSSPQGGVRESAPAAGTTSMCPCGESLGRVATPLQ